MTKSKPLTHLDNVRVTLGWRRFVQERGYTIREAYLLTMATFYCDNVPGSEPTHELAFPKLLPPDGRPSFWQFRHIGRKASESIAFRAYIKRRASTKETEAKK